jgi:hypothetical protein
MRAKRENGALFAVLHGGICDPSSQMSIPDLPKRRSTRRDGWTAERQLHFLDALACTRTVASAAASAGMSREGAYRFRNRSEGTLFAILWDRALASGLAGGEVHSPPLTNGRMLRLLGTHHRRKCGDLKNIGAKRSRSPAT